MDLITLALARKMANKAGSSGSITKDVNDLVNYYTKDKLYTKDEITDLIDAIINVTIEVVNELPSNGETNVIYFVKKDGTVNETYNEYAFINNKWELIGNTEVDLSSYAKKDDLKLYETIEHSNKSDADNLKSAKDYTDKSIKSLNIGDYATLEYVNNKDSLIVNKNDAIVMNFEGDLKNEGYLQSCVPSSFFTPIYNEDDTADKLGKYVTGDGFLCDFMINDKKIGDIIDSGKFTFEMIVKMPTTPSTIQLMGETTAIPFLELNSTSVKMDGVSYPVTESLNHIALVSEGLIWKLYINGKKVGETLYFADKDTKYIFLVSLANQCIYCLRFSDNIKYTSDFEPSISSFDAYGESKIVTLNELFSLIPKSDEKTKLSEFENDTEFITKSYLDAYVQDIEKVLDYILDETLQDDSEIDRIINEILDEEG